MALCNWIFIFYKVCHYQEIIISLLCGATPGLPSDFLNSRVPVPSPYPGSVKEADAHSIRLGTACAVSNRRDPKAMLPMGLTCHLDDGCPIR